jgi:hypothetical protein
MSEDEWLACEDPQALLSHLGETGRRPTERQLRLFAAACCRLWDPLMAAPAGRGAVEAAERYADGAATADELKAARAAAVDESWASANAAEEDIHAGLAILLRGVRSHNQPLLPRWAALLRCIVGNPFAPLRARSFPAGVVGLAQAAYEGDRGLYPLLADALADLSEERAAAHCREEVHAKGCHVLDWVLGQE